MAHRQRKTQLLPMENNLSYRLSILHALLGRQTANIYLSRGLNSHQWKVLSVLFSWPPMPAARITELVTLDKAAISRAVTSLLKLDLADRRLDSATGATNVVPTEAGRATYRAMMADMFALQQRVLATLDEGELRAFFGSIDKIEQKLRAMPSAGGRPMSKRNRSARGARGEAA